MSVSFCEKVRQIADLLLNRWQKQEEPETPKSEPEEQPQHKVVFGNEDVARILLETRFMHACGKKDHSLEWCHARVMFLNSVEEAEEKMNGTRWECALQDKRGAFFGKLYALERSLRISGGNWKIVRAQIHNWNKTIEESKAIIIPRKKQEILSNLERMGFQDLESAWNTMSFAIVLIYGVLASRDYVTFPFWEDMLKIYQNGHLPCAWRERNGVGYFEVY